MKKIFQVIIEAIFWLGIFLSPLLISLIFAAILYFSNASLLWLSIAIATLGLFAGVLFAERIRRKYGCTRFMSRIISTPDIWPTEEKKEKK
jgi:ABC-type bacteriocin/lantibiotic exporter with double-glycine peptidase domain